MSVGNSAANAMPRYPTQSRYRDTKPASIYKGSNKIEFVQVFGLIWLVIEPMTCIGTGCLITAWLPCPVFIMS